MPRCLVPPPSRRCSCRNKSCALPRHCASQTNDDGTQVPAVCSVMLFECYFATFPTLLGPVSLMPRSGWRVLLKSCCDTASLECKIVTFSARPINNAAILALYAIECPFSPTSASYSEIRKERNSRIEHVKESTRSVASSANLMASVI